MSKLGFNNDSPFDLFSDTEELEEEFEDLGKEIKRLKREDRVKNKKEIEEKLAEWRKLRSLIFDDDSEDEDEITELKSKKALRKKELEELGKEIVRLKREDRVKNKTEIEEKLVKWKKLRSLIFDRKDSTDEDSSDASTDEDEKDSKLFDDNVEKLMSNLLIDKFFTFINKRAEFVEHYNSSLSENIIKKLTINDDFNDAILKQELFSNFQSDENDLLGESIFETDTNKRVESFNHTFEEFFKRVDSTDEDTKEDTPEDIESDSSEVIFVSDSPDSSVKHSSEFESTDDSESEEDLNRDIIKPIEKDKIVEAIKQRGPKFKVKIGNLRQNIINIAKELNDENSEPINNIKVIRSAMKMSFNEWRIFRKELAKKHPSTSENVKKSEEERMKLLEEFVLINNSTLIIKNYFRVLNLIKEAKNLNTPINVSGRSNLQITVSDSGYMIESELQLVKDLRTKDILRKINLTKFNRIFG